MSFRLTLTAKANGFVWLFFRSTYTTITTSRWVNFISPRRSFHILTNSNGVSNCVAASTKIVEQPSCGQRLLSTKITDENVPIVSYEEVKDLPNHPEKLLIDVREPLELRQHGEIPNCINIPLGELTDALDLSEEKFEQKYGRAKPTKSTNIIFYCQVGFRSGKATVTAANLGYTNVKNYKGSFVEYAAKEGYASLFGGEG